MPAISFSTLKDKILDGSKKQTIRPNNPKTNYWLQFHEGDRLIGFWNMRTPQREKLFESIFSEDPFPITYYKLVYNHDLMVKDGFTGVDDAYLNWFKPHYGSVERQQEKEFVVIRWK